jgi:hypothetical protein
LFVAVGGVFDGVEECDPFGGSAGEFGGVNVEHVVDGSRTW